MIEDGEHGVEHDHNLHPVALVADILQDQFYQKSVQWQVFKNLDHFVIMINSYLQFNWPIFLEQTL